MATPIGNRANAARGFFARERRRKKQDQKDFDIAGLVQPGGTPFFFGGAVGPGNSPNALLLPASADIVLSSDVNLVAGLVGIFDETTGISYPNAELINGAGFGPIRHRFPEGHTIRIASLVGGTVAVITVFFRGPKSSRTMFGTGLIS